MRQEYLFQLLSTFEPEDWRDCHDFLNSPLHNKKKLPVRLFEAYAEEAEQWKELTRSEMGLKTAFPPARLWHRLYPGEPFRDQRLRRVSMELKRLLQRFVLTRAQTSSAPELEGELELLQFLLERNALDLFVKQVAKTDRLLSQLPFRDGDYHLFRLRLEKIRNDYFIRSQQTTDSFELVSEELDAFYLVRKLESFCSMLTRQKRFSKAYSMSFESEVVSLARKMTAEKFPAVAIWLAMYDLEKGSVSLEHFERLAGTIETLKSKLPLPQLRQVRGYMFNFLARQNVPATRQGYGRLFALCQKMLVEGTLHFAGRITAPFFRAYIHSACLAGEVEAAGAFLKNEGTNLAGTNQSDSLEYFHLMLRFFHGEYRLVLSKVAQKKFSSPRYEIQARALQLQSWFELGEDEAFLRGTSAFRKYLARKEFEGERFTQGFREFGRLGERLGKWFFLGMGDGSQLKNEINQATSSERLWLLEKLKDHN